jgi:hypothetical protein
MFHAPVNITTTVTFSVLFVAASMALLYASGALPKHQQLLAVNTGNVGHLYEGGIPGYPYFGGYPNYGHSYGTGGDHSYDYGYGGYTFYRHHHHHHHHSD